MADEGPPPAAAAAAAAATMDDDEMGTGALTLCSCCCCEGSMAGGPLVGGGGGMKKDPMGAYPSLLLYDGVGDVDDLLKLNTLESEFWKRGGHTESSLEGWVTSVVLVCLSLN